MNFAKLLLIACLWTTAATAEMGAHEEFERKLSLSYGVQSQSYDFNIQGGGQMLEYGPNMGSVNMLNVSYAGLGGISWGHRQGLTESDHVKGKTNFVDWRFNFPYRRLNVFLFFSRYKGMYLKNTSEIDPHLPEPFITYPNLYTQNMGADLTWVLNPDRFSLAAIMDFTERQVKSGGSWLIGASLTETIFRNEGAIIPSQVKPGYEGDAEMYEGRVRAMNLKVGYGYTDVYRRRWFMSALANFGLGPQQVVISTPSEDYSISRLALNLLEFYACVGYNGEAFFSGFNISSSTSTYQAEKAEIKTVLVNGGLFIGARF